MGKKYLQNDTFVGKISRMNMPTFVHYAIELKITAKNKRNWPNPAQPVAPKNPNHSHYTSQGAPKYPFRHTIIVCISVLSGPFWPSLHQRNTTKYSDLRDCLIMNMKRTSKLLWEKSYVYQACTIQNEYQMMQSPGLRRHRK